MIIFKKSIPRRTFLHGLGASIALPMLDAMVPALAKPLEGLAQMPMRIGYVYTPNGIIRERFRPTTTGADYEMTDILKQWEPFRDQLLILSNLDNAETDRINGHAGGATSFLTSAVAKKTLSDVQAGTSVDQIIAKTIGQETPLGSLEMCIENAAEMAGQSEGAYSSAYTNTITWASPTSPLPMVHRPRDIFERLFGGAGASPEARQARVQEQKSILDFVKEDFARTKKKLGSSDLAKLDEFTETLRDVETRIQKSANTDLNDMPDIQRPIGVPEYGDHVDLMFDLALIAFQTDMTRVFTFMIAREFSELVFTNLGHSDPYHPTTHHRGNQGKIKRAGDINVYQASLFGKFLTKMRNIKDIDGSSMLDNSMLVYGAGLGDGDIHSQWNVPLALLGGGRGKLKGGRHIAYKDGTPLANLHVTMLNMLGIETEKFGYQEGTSTGELDLTQMA
jgi:hypothetical protein